MLESETTTLADAEADLEEEIAAVDDELADLPDDSAEADALEGRRDRLKYLKNGIEYHADEWGADAEVTVGALTAGEEAMMDRERPDHAGDKERRLWYVAAATDDAPYVGDDLSETFANVADLHPAFVAWVEARSNALGVAGNR